jgi:ssDNA-binding Zn-finger/Zn-ribbon topoisomerase 1
MVVHKFVCGSCGSVVKDTNTKYVHKCPKCGADMRWDLGGNVSGRGDYEHISDSLAIHPDQIPEHRQKFPGVDIIPDGRLRFTSTKQQERYANRCGFDKKSQRIRKRGIRIA